MTTGFVLCVVLFIFSFEENDDDTVGRRAFQLQAELRFDRLSPMRMSVKETLFLRGFALAKIPLLFFARPTVVSINKDECVISLPFTRRNKNHLNSMYFGALCIGADAAGGMIAQRAFNGLKGAKGSLIFKDFQANFLKRAEGDVFLTCKDGPAIHAAIKTSYETAERVSIPVHITATVPDKFGDEPVAKFVLTLSLKVKKAGAAT